MTAVNLTQSEADALLDIEKRRSDTKHRDYPSLGGRISVPLVSMDGPPHLHLYREGFGDKWAVPVPPDRFPKLLGPWQTLTDFMRFCNVVEAPYIRRDLST